jgi:hypothetical protein
MTKSSFPVYQDSLPRWLWFCLPVAFCILHFSLQLSLPQESVNGLLKENGPYEYLQVVIIAAAFVFGLLTLKNVRSLKPRWLLAWTALATLGCLYITGEEISWGQQIFKWATPEGWMSVNDHGETNLHNTSSWIDQKPKTLIEYGMYASVLLLPLLQRWKKDIVPARFAVILPAVPMLSVTAAALLFVRFAKISDKLISGDQPLLQRVSEVQEVYIYFFMLLYMIVLRQRLLGLSKK